MKVKKYELVRIIDKLKSVVQKNTVHPALGGVLVKEGYLIAANGEITIQVKCEDAEGESFIIPMKAFDLIKNLPEGDVELLHDDKNVVTIKMEKIKNSYQSFPAENFIYSKTDMESGEELTLPGKSFMEAISHVIYAAAEKEPSKPMLEGIYLEGCDKYINLVATDGHVLAWDRIKADGIADLKIIVPKAAAKKLLSMGMDDDVNVSYSANSAIFRTDGYVIYTRLLQGKYLPYKKMFCESDNYTIVGKSDLVGAMTRAKMCTDEKSPAVFDISENEITVSIRDNIANYQEKVALQEKIKDPIKIGFDSRLVLETIKAFTCDNITLNLTRPVNPMVVEAEDSDMKALVLPVRLKDA